ncbi:hypothetical protein PRZ48_008980 [Zasmidium cellare]|uniref:Uncharacterized protein n=1 Tax=Zasmidium cellare TaxID=395010 RepID=A0ABR0EI28_ZASCE|nr:hypothetical protein PRZ48_008980 [Zasmidium cellare]
MKQLFVLQRVSKKWQEVICDSPALQMKMFLRPCSVPIRPLLETEDNFPLYTPKLRLNPAAGMRRFWGEPRHPVAGRDKPTDFGAWEVGKMNGSENIEYFIYNNQGLRWGDLHRGMENFERGYLREHGSTPPAGTVNIGFRVKTSSLGDEVRNILDVCRGRQDWVGLCGCLWILQEEDDYENAPPDRTVKH